MDGAAAVLRINGGSGGSSDGGVLSGEVAV